MVSLGVVPRADTAQVTGLVAVALFLLAWVAIDLTLSTAHGAYRLTRRILARESES